MALTIIQRKRVEEAEKRLLIQLGNRDYEKAHSIADDEIASVLKDLNLQNLSYLFKQLCRWCA